MNHVATVLYELVEKINIETLAQQVQSGLAKIPDAQRLGYILDAVKVEVDLQPLAMLFRQKNRLIFDWFQVHKEK